MSKNVLIPVDQSEHAEQAFKFALEEHPDADLTVFHVVDLSDSDHMDSEGVAMYPSQTDYERAVEDATAFLEEYVDRAKAEGIDARATHEVGNPAREILSFADDNDIDQIVIGSRGRTGVSRVLLGSVAEKVARRASVPVTIVR